MDMTEAEFVSGEVSGSPNPNNELRQRKKVEEPGSTLVLREKVAPPSDDCCPICFGVFNLPCKTSCGHWFCANCILMFWNYCNGLHRCKCPICSCLITKLVPEASQSARQEDEVVEILKKIDNYNSLFVGGLRGLVMKVHQIPRRLNRYIEGLMDPSKYLFNFFLIRIFSCVMNLLQIFEVNFIPLVMFQVIDLSAMAIFLILTAIGLYRHPRRLDPRIRRFFANRIPRLF